jgi:hypothetical protein
MLYYARRERVAGVTCDVYASFPYGSKSVELASEVFVDPVHYNCVQKYATYNGKLPYQIYTYKWGDQGDWWLPSECEVEAYSGGGRLVSRLKAVPVRVQPVAGDAEFFDLRFTDGMKVTRRIVPKTKGARARVTQESAVVRDGEVVSDAGGVGFGWRSPWLWAGGVVLALAVCVLLFRRRRRKLSEGSS